MSMPRSIADRLRLPAIAAPMFLVSGLDMVLAALAADSSPARYQLALQLARIPEQIKGFGHVKARNLKTAQHNQRLLLAQWRDPQAAAKAA